MLPSHPDERQAAQTRSSKLVDLVVIGGGINGSGIAVDAAGRGLSVLLCEQHDLAAHTSSASSKLWTQSLRPYSALAQDSHGIISPQDRSSFWDLQVSGKRSLPRHWQRSFSTTSGT